MLSICPFKFQGILANSKLTNLESEMSLLAKLAQCEKAKCALWMELEVEEDGRSMVREACSLQLGWSSLGSDVADLTGSLEDVAEELTRQVQSIAAIAQVASGVAMTRLGIDQESLSKILANIQAQAEGAGEDEEEEEEGEDEVEGEDESDDEEDEG